MINADRILCMHDNDGISLGRPLASRERTKCRCITDIVVLKPNCASGPPHCAA